MSTFFQQTAQAMIAKHIDRFPLLKLDQVIDWQPIEQYLNRDLSDVLNFHLSHSLYHRHYTRYHTGFIVSRILPYDRPPILPPHLRPFLTFTFSPLLQCIRSGQYRLPCRNHRYLDRFLAAAVFLPQPARSVRDSSAGRLTVGSGQCIRVCFRQPAGETMAGHYHLMREVVGFQG